MATKPQRKKKAMTLEDLGAAIQRDFTRMATKDDIAALRRDMATKDDLRKIQEDLADGLGDVRTRIAVAKEELQEQIAGLRYAKEIDELRTRVQRVERKLGMERSPHAA
jgi:hypothetical protein